MPPIINTASQRDPALLNAIIDQFEVESSTRYRPRALVENGPRLTFCNIYVSDLSAAVCAPIPHNLAGKWQDVRANLAWLRAGYNGWKPCDAFEAQAAANGGHPAVVVWDPLERKHGHIAMMVPAGTTGGLWISQAGARCYRRAPLMAGFGSHTTDLQYFRHE